MFDKSLLTFYPKGVISSLSPSGPGKDKIEMGNGGVELVRPFANTKTAKYVNEQIERLKSVKSQREIAFEIGYEKPNILSMIKRGETKLPLDKVQPLATAMGVDPLHLLRMALEDYLPVLAATFDSIISRAATQNEWDGLVLPWRETTQNSDPNLTAEQSAALGQFLKKVRFDVERINSGNKYASGKPGEKARGHDP